MSYPHRCLICNARRSLCRKLSEYTIVPRCKTCGSRNYYLDKWRMKNEMGIKPSCDCGAYHFRHRKGSGYCYHRQGAEQRDIERRA